MSADIIIIVTVAGCGVSRQVLLTWRGSAQGADKHPAMHSTASHK